MENNEIKQESVVKESSHIGLKILLVLLIIIVILLSGLFIYNKFIAKTETKTTSKETTKKDNNSSTNTTQNDKTIEYVSIDSKESLKLNEDNTYELKYEKDGNIKENNGIYKKNDNGYLLDEKYNAIVTNDIIEIEDILSEEFMKSNLILFNKKSITTIKESISNSVTNLVKEREQIWKKDNPQVAEVQKVDSNVGQCMRYAFNGEQINKDSIVCSITYNNYLKDYDYDVCKNELSVSIEKLKFSQYAISSGSCEKDYVRNWSSFSLDQNNNYKVIGTFTGL